LFFKDLIYSKIYIYRIRNNIQLT